MKKNEIIELNGVEYTLELNRDSFVQIDRACNIKKSMSIITRGLYNYMDDEELNDDFNPESLIVSAEDLEKEIELKNETMHKTIERAFLIWLYPNHHLKPSEVKELLAPYFDEQEKSDWLSGKYWEYLQECIAMKTNYEQELKNLKAQANKKK